LGKTAYDAIMMRWKGKRIAILGERGVGKSHLHSFLTTGTIPEEYIQTAGAQKTKANHLKITDLNLRIKDSRDVGGDITNYISWEKILQEADIVIYLVNVAKCMQKDEVTLKRLDQDADQIGEWLGAKMRSGEKFPCIVVGTHLDVHFPRYFSLPPTEVEELETQIRTSVDFKKVARNLGGNGTPVVVGSMANQEATARMVVRIFKSIA